ncbi:uncharacterized protein BCR38DRAFT_333608 [Pseudomassariella vexata]|uniref:Zn(2)-C6 fungal-type domain-containing protein n=1 Tax=Pseudomassariella vexata TaxID=1141098 RepID=A0A1Y2EF99_9PEZI|nr:uncharacterized protein BCR38DRAFT_333608 [Pseudomassariella vexata]ORY69475.1 hypothetical protein BCR38DRAFT_333608 [Pseudomassariella vexata]
MVGVKGKYKGCNTCRNRRVKCDNTRPFCKKCIDHGRACEGYERETVFIVGTVDDKGRCALHPPRNLQRSKKAKTSAESSEPAKVEFSAVQPLQPAWDETIALASVGGLHQVRFVALHTNLDSVRQQQAGNPETGEVKLVLPTSQRVDVRPTFRKEDFKLNSQCFIHLPESSSSQRAGKNSNEGLCLFIYEHNSSAAYSNKAPWKDPAAIINPIRQLGPGYCQTFPAHHFFTRIYRPNAIFASLLNRRPTHLASSEWMLDPWKQHPKTSLDNLLDIIALLPTLVARADQITPLPPSMGRRLKAKDLLNNCASIEKQLENWYAGIEQAAAANRDNPLLYWIGEPSLHAQIPFADTFAFASPALGLAHIYYWSSLITLHTCMHSLIEAIFESGGGATTNNYGFLTDLSPSLDPVKYNCREIRKLAANVCRGLDWALGPGVGQPDLMAAPLWVVENFYEGIHGELEGFWCEGFRARMVERAKAVEEEMVGEGRGWVEVGRLG